MSESPSPSTSESTSESASYSGSASESASPSDDGITEYYCDINDDYNVADPSHDGSTEYPFCRSETQALLIGGVINGVLLYDDDTLYFRGWARTAGLLENIELTLTIHSWPGRAPWVLDDSSSSHGNIISLVNVGDTLDIYDGILGVTMLVDAGNTGNRISFYNCLSWGAEFYAETNGSQRIYELINCTIVDGMTLLGAAGVAAGELYLRDCVFIDLYFGDALLWNIVEFTGANIFNQSYAVVDQLGTTAVETGWALCTFSYVLSAVMPDLVDLALDDLSAIAYTLFGLPLVFDQPARWDTVYLQQGWFDKFRYGYGAFYFMFETNASADPEFGAAPLEVDFSANATSGLVDENEGYLWDFGDGEQTKLKDSTHIFIAGEYEVSVTVTTLWGAVIVTYIKIYVYENDYTPGGRNVTKTTEIFRLAVPQEKKQGNGWSRYTGEDYPNAIGLVGTCTIFTENDEERVIVTDCNSFKHYWLGKKDHWVDGSNDDYGGSEIDSDILFRELTPPVQATAKLKHLESEAGLKPWFKEQRNIGTYNAYGFRNNFLSSMYFREDSSPDDTAVVKYFPRKAQIVSNRHIESESLQMGLRLSGAPWRVISAQVWYEQIDTAGAPSEKQMSEKTWAEMFESTVIWIGRSLEIVKIDGSHSLPWDKGGNQRTTGKFTGITEGPDGNTRSAIVFGSGDYLSTAVDLSNINLSILLWVKSPGANTINIFVSSSFTIRLVKINGEWNVQWVGEDTWSVPLSSDLWSWTALSIIKYGNLITIYENGARPNVRSLSHSVISYGIVTFYNGPVSGFEPRVIETSLTADAVKWIYDDVIQNHGNSTCAMY